MRNNFKRKAKRQLTKVGRGLKERWRSYKTGRAEERVSKKELREIERKAERRGFQEEAERQARLRGERMARRKFAPKPKSRISWKAPRVDLWGLRQFSNIRLRSVGSVMMSGLGKPKRQRKRKRKR